MRKCELCDSVLTGSICSSCGMRADKPLRVTTNDARFERDAKKYRNLGKNDPKHTTNRTYTSTNTTYQDENNHSSNPIPPIFNNWDKHTDVKKNPRGCMIAIIIIIILLPIISSIFGLIANFVNYGLYSFSTVTQVSNEPEIAVDAPLNDDAMLSEFIQTGFDTSLIPTFEEMLMDGVYVMYLNQGEYIVDIHLPVGTYTMVPEGEILYTSIDGEEIIPEDIVATPLTAGTHIRFGGSGTLLVFIEDPIEASHSVLNENIFDYRTYQEGDIAGIHFPAGTYDIWSMEGDGYVQVVYPSDSGFEDYLLFLNEFDSQSYYNVYANVALPEGAMLFTDDGLIVSTDNSIYEYLDSDFVMY